MTEAAAPESTATSSFVYPWYSGSSRRPILQWHDIMGTVRLEDERGQGRLMDLSRDHSRRRHMVQAPALLAGRHLRYLGPRTPLRLDPSSWIGQVRKVLGIRTPTGKRSRLCMPQVCA